MTIEIYKRIQDAAIQRGLVFQHKNSSSAWYGCGPLNEPYAGVKSAERALEFAGHVAEWFPGRIKITRTNDVDGLFWTVQFTIAAGKFAIGK